MQGNVCGNCGRPVYFAERKTSLGRDWHPNCLRCKECGKILNPGQHAEHKGLPYCHTPCYKALFGPSILGYGSNVHTPANYRNGKPFDGITHTSNMDGISTKIFSFAKSVQNNVRSAMSFDTKERPAATGGETTTKYTQEEQEMLKKVESYNAYYEGKVRHQMTTEKTESEFLIEGPLRIYWGVTRPIQLEQCDNIKPPPVSSWRHSLYPTRTPKQRPVTVIEGRDPVTRAHANGVRFAEDIAELTPPASPKKSYGFDDSIIASQTDGVVRRKNLRKFNTVAYRGDAPNKWKRASINGHIYNYDTSVFTPVLGSCTSVSVDSSMNTSQVIRTLMEKFKVVNRPDEYQLCLVTEKEERLLTDRDYPLALRIEMGPDETKTRLFIKEKQQEAPKTPTISSMPIQEEPPEILPEEVETLLVLPDAVLTGVLKKYEEDEKKDIKVIKMRFEQIKRRIINRMEELRKTQSA